MCAKDIERPVLATRLQPFTGDLVERIRLPRRPNVAQSERAHKFLIRNRRASTGREALMQTLFRLCRLVVVFLVAGLSLIEPARATSYSTDQSDIWSAVGEDGWAIQFIQRASTIFATIYVYDASTNPIWYSATLEADKATPLLWKGDLYVTRGPWFGAAPFNSAAVQLRKVGTMTWLPTRVSSGTLTYDVDGVVVTKELQRYLIHYDTLSGSYYGGFVYFSGCTNSGGAVTTELASFSVAQTGLNVTITESIIAGGSCTYSGTYSQAGQMGLINGTFSCSNGVSGTFQLAEIQVTISGITGRLSNTSQSCNAVGRFGGVRTQ
jgi:hypothetical protein